MTDSLYTRLSSIIKPSTVTDIAAQLGAPDQSVARGLALSAATAFSALASKAGDSESMRQVIDVASRTPANMLSSITGSQVSDAASPLMSTGRRFLTSLFGGSQSWVTDLIGHEAGLGSGAAGTIMALGANMLLNFIGGKVRDEGMTATSLAGFLRSEGPAVRKMLPASFEEAFTRHFGMPESARAIDSSPVVAQSVKKERSYFPWIATAAILATALWYGLRPNRIEVPNIPTAPPVGTSGTFSYSPPNLGNYVPRTLVDGTVITVPERGVENRLLAFIVDPSRPVDRTTWFDFDRLLFDTGSATLRPESQAQLRDVAAILKANPNCKVKIGGYTDNVGSPASNLTLSQERADNVRAELVGMGIDADRLTAEGYGEAHAVADNSTEAGRAMNRRISMLVIEK